MAPQPWRFSLHLRTMQIWTRFDYPRYHNNDPPLDGHDAARDLQFWFRGDHFEMQSLRSLCHELGVTVYDMARGGPRHAKEELLEIAARALEFGRLVAAYEPQRIYSSSREEPEVVAPQPATVPEWFDLQVVWDDSGEPVRGLPVVVQPAQTSYVMRETDAGGRIRIDPVPSGPCEVRSSFDGTSCHDCVGFVGIGPVVRSDEEKAQALSRQDTRPKAIVTATRHKVRAGETLDGLARSVNLTSQKLAKFNFGTDGPSEINKHLAHDVGATRKAADGKNYIFDDSDDPGIIILPKAWTRRLVASQCHVIRVRPIDPPVREFVYSI